jgi:hypothetical protein
MRVRASVLKKLVVWSAVPAALIGSAALVWQASYSAFSATTQNPTNNWATGSVALTDDDSNTAMFNATSLKPGSTGSKCIAVTSNGSLPAAVKLYGTSYAQTKSLGTYITLTVDEGSGGGFAAGCSGFTSSTQIFNGTLDAFGTTKTAYASGVGSWTPTGTAGESKVYKFTYTVSASTPDTSQGGTAAIGFTWESQNT